jgi:Family of unknown function (DUF6675)
MRLVLLAIQMLLLLVPLGAEDLFSRYFSEASLRALRGGRTLEASLPPDFALTLIPAIASRETVAAEVRDRRPSIGVEMTRIIGGLPQRMDTKDGWLLLYNCLHAVSTMKGIQYYSVTRGGNHVLFTESYVVDSAQSRNRVDDPVATQVPPEDSIFTFQEDGTFGKNIYQENYRYENDQLLVKIENITTINFLFLPIIQPRDLVSQVALIPSGNEVAFYGVSYLTTGFPLGDRHSREESLKNRLVAMADWLKARLAGGAQ